MVPQIYGERGINACEAYDEMIFEGANSVLGVFSWV